MKKSFFRFIVIAIMLISLSSLQSLINVNLFQSFYRDAKIAENIYIDPGFKYTHTSIASFDWSTFSIGVKGGYPINNKIEANAGLSFISISPDEGDGESGISDLMLAARYLITDAVPSFAAGGFVTLPIGSEDIGQSKLNFGFFGAMRYLLKDTAELTANLGLNFYETLKIKIEEDGVKEETEYETALVLGTGIILQLKDNLSIVPEFVMETEVDYSMLSCGVQYELGSSGKIRGAFGLGLDDGAPDMSLEASYQIEF